MKPRRRSGFTLFQLLVVLALLAILFALLLPAVVKVRSSASRVSSVNNIKQLALAVHNYHDVHGKMPPGTDANHFSATARLLPYVEQANLFQALDFNKPITAEPNAAMRKLRVNLFLSPSDPQATVSPDLGATNYLFSAGSKPGLADNDGVFFLDSKIKFQEILDGTSNTLMIGETLKGDGGTKAVDVARQHVKLKAAALKDLKDDAGVQDFKDSKNIAGDRCASWMDGRFLQGTFAGTRIMNDPRPDVSCDGMGGLSGLRTMEDSVNIGFCDGSVRSIRKKLDEKVWKLLTSRNDGQPIPVDF